MIRFTLWVAAVMAALAATAAAQGYPVKPIRLVVPHAAGGGSDTVARLLGAEITRAWGQQVVVENRVGAGGIIGSEHVARSAADGYTLLVNEIGGLVIRLALYQKLPFDLARDFTAVAPVAYGPNVLVVHPSLPVRSTRELLALARARPGQLNFAVPGVGSVAHLAGVEIEQITGVKWIYIPYKGGAPALIDLVGGQAHFGISGMLATAPHIRSGKLRALAIATRQRDPARPELPTLAETVPGHESGSWQSVLAPAGVPREITVKWNAEIARINAMPGMIEKLAALGSAPASMTADQFQQFIGTERTRWARIVRAADLKPE